MCSIVTHYGLPAVVLLKKTLQLYNESDHKSMFDLEPDTQRIELIEKSAEFDLTHVTATYPYAISGLHNLLMSSKLSFFVTDLLDHLFLLVRFTEKTRPIMETVDSTHDNHQPKEPR